MKNYGKDFNDRSWGKCGNKEGNEGNGIRRKGTNGRVKRGQNEKRRKNEEREKG